MVQVNNGKLVLRFRMKKTGSLQYISHLDLVRTMHKVIVRAGLPLWYTEGFNPKPKMIFAAPLSIGTESVCEFMDIRLNEYIDPAEAMNRLNANMTQEMQVTEAYYPETKFTDLKWLSYTITISSPTVSCELVDKANALFAMPEITVQKKNSDALMNIKPLVKSATAEIKDNNLVISAILSADPSAFLNPEYLVNALRSHTGVLSSTDLMSESYTVMREAAYFADMSEFR